MFIALLMMVALSVVATLPDDYQYSVLRQVYNK